MNIGIAEYAVTPRPHRLITLGLGSCVGVTLWDRRLLVAGLAHIMLPDSTNFKPSAKPAKFADLGVPRLVRDMERLGAKIIRMEAKLAGGAQMFFGKSDSPVMNIGARNVAAVKAVLARLGIRVVAEDTGGNIGRTIILDSVSGGLSIRSLGQGVKEL